MAKCLELDQAWQQEEDSGKENLKLMSRHRPGGHKECSRTGEAEQKGKGKLAGLQAGQNEELQSKVPNPMLNRFKVLNILETNLGKEVSLQDPELSRCSKRYPYSLPRQSNAICKTKERTIDREERDLVNSINHLFKKKVNVFEGEDVDKPELRNLSEIPWSKMIAEKKSIFTLMIDDRRQVQSLQKWPVHQDSSVLRALGKAELLQYGQKQAADVETVMQNVRKRNELLQEQRCPICQPARQFLSVASR